MDEETRAKKSVWGTEDLVERRKHSNDIFWSTRSIRSIEYEFRSKCFSPEQMKEAVLNSTRIQHIISRLSTENGESVKSYEEKANLILDEMGHQLRMRTIRGFGYVLSKCMRQLFTGIFINREGIEQIRSYSKRYPIVYMPTHRSYVDFMLLSYVCFTYGLPIPVIAAGLDFLSMKGMTTILRNAGAFFIRRSFGNDKLYWNIFSEYVQILVRNSQPPVEFFVEGTRSRSGKSLFPKLGFLSTVMEPFFKSEILDIVIVPVNISYDRTLEETLYSYELLGVPKPKESTSGLFKARQILKENFGDINFTIAQPILMSDFCNVRMFKRNIQHGPRYLFSLSQEEQNLCKQLANRVIREHQIHAILSPFTLVASLILVNLQQGEFEMPLPEFVIKLSAIKDFFTRLGGRLRWKDEASVEDVVRNCLSAHGSVFQITSEVVSACEIPTMLASDKIIHGLKGHSLKGCTISKAISSVLLSYYSNHTMHVFIRPAMIAVILDCFPSGCHKDLLLENYTFLEKMLSVEFIFEPEETLDMFIKSVSSLEEMGILFVVNDVVFKSSSKQQHDLFIYLTQLLDPFLIAYKVVCQVICHATSSGQKGISKATIVRKSQGCIEQLLLKKRIVTYVSLSLDILNNAVFALVQLKLLAKDKNDQFHATQTLYQFLKNLDQVTWLNSDIQELLLLLETQLTSKL